MKRKLILLIIMLISIIIMIISMITIILIDNNTKKELVSMLFLFIGAVSCRVVVEFLLEE